MACPEYDSKWSLYILVTTRETRRLMSIRSGDRVIDVGCGTGAFDVVVSCNMFHYVRRPVAALREVSRVLRGGGELVITSG